MVIRKKCENCKKLKLMDQFQQNGEYPDKKDRACKVCKEQLEEQSITIKTNIMKKEAVKKETVIEKETLKAKRARVAAEQVSTDGVDDMLNSLQEDLPKEELPKAKKEPKSKKEKVAIVEETEDEDKIIDPEVAVDNSAEVEVEAKAKKEPKSKKEKVEKEPSAGRISRQVEQIELVDGVPTANIIETWSSVRLAGEGIDKSSAGIRNTCRNVNKSAHGFFWRYKTEEVAE